MALTNEQAISAENKVAQLEGTTAVLSEPKKFTYDEFQFRSLNKNEILVRMEGCGLCASSIPVWQGREWFSYPLEAGAPGHEGWGIIEDTGGEVEKFKKGQRVSLLAGNAFSTHVICEADKAVFLPPNIPNIPFPGEPLGCAMNIFKRSDIQSGQTIMIIGIGFLGAALIQLAKQNDVQIIAVSRRESSLKLAEVLGADAVFRWDEKQQLNEYLNDKAPGGCQRVIECVGKQNALDLATDVVAERGKVIIAGYHQEDLRQVNMQIWNWKGIDVINAHERDPEIYKSGIKSAIDAIQEGKIDLEKLLTHQFSFNQLEEAMETLENYPDGFTKAYINYNL